MHVDCKMFTKEGAVYDHAITVDIFGDDSPDDLILNALREQKGSYAAIVTWDEERHCYHIEADWAPDPDWGDDYMAIIRRLETVVPKEMISVRLERPNEPLYHEQAFIDIEC